MAEKLTKLDAIFQWNMTVPEAETYKIALTWESELDKHAPEHMKSPEWHRRNHISKHGDPRKSFLFKQCWKLRRETKGLLKEEEIRLYISANLTILKAHNAYMEINTMCGEQAWFRWKIWKRLYDKKMAQINNNPPPLPADSKLIRELARTKRFIFERCDGEPTKDKIHTFIQEGFFKVWILQTKISMYYVILSPFVKDFLDKLSKDCIFDVTLFQEKLNQEIIDYFNFEFQHEFK